MKIIGFNFSKISIEKKSAKFDDLKIESRIAISKIEESNVENIKTKESFLTIKWTYSIHYNPSIAVLQFEGVLLVSMDQKEAKEIIKKWEDKKLDNEFNANILNVILKKVNIKAIELEDDFNLPTHFKLPGLKLN